MGGGQSITSNALIPDELKPLYTQAVGSINKYSKANPLGGYAAPNPEQVAGLSYNQRLAQNNVGGLFGASPFEALAAQAIGRQAGLAGQTSTSGPANFGAQPSLLDYYQALGGPGQGPSVYQDPNMPAPAPGTGGIPPGTATPPPTTPPGTPPAGPPSNTGPPGTRNPPPGTPGQPTVKSMTTAGQTQFATAPTGADQNLVITRPPNTGPGTGPGGAAEPIPTAPDLGSLLSLGQGPTYPGQQPVGNAAGVQAGYKQVTGSELINDPAVAAALQNFSKTVQPGIQAQAGLMGLGRSDSANRAVATAQGSILEPLYENAFARQQATNDRGYQATETELARRDAALQRVAQANSDSANQYAGLAGQRYNEATGAVNTAAGVGQQAQDTLQKGATSAFNDFLRRQGLSEQSVYAPFGSVAGGSIGSKSVSSGK